MEQNVQVIARKAWHIMKIAYFLLRKNISKRKLLLLELKYLATKRPKLHHKLHHHNHNGAYEFSCSNTPISHTKRSHKNKEHYPHAPIVNEHEARELHAVNRVLDMLTLGDSQNGDVEDSLFFYSPVLPGFGFGQSPLVRELRVTDSPYLMQNCDDGEMSNFHVDEQAEEFIKKFYDQLHQQRIVEA